ncbi:hypothetical protein Tco_0853450 [Tanacetum coccineum]
MEVIPDEEEVAIDAIPLAVNSLKIMLRSFDREDLEDLYKLVKAKYESTRPVEDLDLLLWGDLKTIFLNPSQNSLRSKGVFLKKNIKFRGGLLGLKVFFMLLELMRTKFSAEILNCSVKVSDAGELQGKYAKWLLLPAQKLILVKKLLLLKKIF